MSVSRPAALRLLAAAAAAATLAGCTDGSSASPAPVVSQTTAPVSPPASPPAAPVEVVTVDWTDPRLDVPLAGGWSLRDCLGDAPMVCVHDGDRPLGIIEAMRSPLGDDLTATLEADGLEAALRSYVAEYHETFSTDRTEGCAEGYGYEEHPTELVTLAGSPALRYGFSGIAADGTEAERNITYVTIVDGELELVTALSNTPASCVYSETMMELEPAELRRIEPELDALMARSILPE